MIVRMRRARCSARVPGFCGSEEEAERVSPRLQDFPVDELINGGYISADDVMDTPNFCPFRRMPSNYERISRNFSGRRDPEPNPRAAEVLSDAYFDRLEKI